MYASMHNSKVIVCALLGRAAVKNSPLKQNNNEINVILLTKAKAVYYIAG